MACETEEQAVADAMAELTLAQITWAIEQAQATLALMEMNIRQNELMLAQSALNMCRMGGVMMSSVPVLESLKSLEKLTAIQRDSIKAMQSVHDSVAGQ